ncbi:MAG: response regulator [Coleofasciculus sp. C1-SOL-03]|uniref:response regulator n=1 Tax=Coleofasciculus sp. C1-SOL-03 TaxID=3069522 RepID=UPI0032FB7FAE
MAKILVIEDELSVRDNILELLEANNFQVTESDNGLAGIQLATQQLPDLIVCDVMMPELDGYEVLTALRSNPATQTIPFIFLTAKASRDDWRQGMELGSDDYLTKPFTAKELLSAIATRLSKQMAIQQQSEAKLDELRSNITSALPRELQTPLNSIVGTSQTLLADYIEAAPVRSMIEDIQASGQQLSRSIQNFLLYAELELAETSSERRRTFQTYQTRFSSAIISTQAIAKAREFNRESDLLLNFGAKLLIT